jgi:mono/diheme cytochrome c family protein
MNTRSILAATCALCLGSCFFAAAQESKNAPKMVASAHDPQTTADANARAASAPATASATTAKPLPKNIEAFERSEGEKRFRTNCGRCHQAPHKFPPRTMATVIRHMRVRAMITDEDMRLILRYMTQ